MLGNERVNVKKMGGDLEISIKYINTTVPALF